MIYFLSFIIVLGIPVFLHELGHFLAAKSVGIKTCYVYRPDEFGNGKSEDSGDTARFDLVVDSFTEITGSIL